MDTSPSMCPRAVVSINDRAEGLHVVQLLMQCECGWVCVHTPTSLMEIRNSLNIQPPFISCYRITDLIPKIWEQLNDQQLKIYKKEETVVALVGGATNDKGLQDIITAYCKRGPTQPFNLIVVSFGHKVMDRVMDRGTREKYRFSYEREQAETVVRMGVVSVRPTTIISSHHSLWCSGQPSQKHAASHLGMPNVYENVYVLIGHWCWLFKSFRVN